MDTLKKFTGIEKSWILYDVANSAFVLVMVTTVMPIFFKDIAAVGVPAELSTSYWGYANSIASLILAILAPVMGVFADFRDSKKKFFLFFLIVGLFFNVSLGFVGEGSWVLCIIFFVLARVGWSGTNLFYDAFLVDVTEKERMDRVSAAGFGWGYIGSVIPFLVVMGLILLWKEPGQSGAIGEMPARVGFIIVAVWWFIFSLPMLKNVKQKYYIEKVANPVRDGFGRLWNTFRDIKQYKQVFMFLLAYFFYIDGVGTMISMAAVYGRDAGLGVTLLLVVILMIQVVGFPFSILYGKLSERFGVKPMLFVGIAVYTVVSFFGFMLPDIANETMKVGAFWFMAFLVASSQGGIQSLSRSLYGKLIPPEKSSEFFGFYNIFGKFASIMGPALLGGVGALTGHSKWGVLSIVVLFMLGAFFLTKVDLEEAHG